MGRRLQPPTRKLTKVRTRKRDTPAEPAWPSFPGGAQYVGTSNDGRVAVWVDPNLGAQGLQNATDLVNDADRIGTLNDSFFASAASGCSVVLFALGGATDGTGGADHGGCDFVSGGAIEVCVSFGSSMRCSALFEAELSECMMGANLCGVSTGEALSRWCAMLVSSNALGDFATGPTWAQDGMPNYVDTVDPTDGNADSTGCGMVFLSWLQSLGYAFPLVAQTLVAGGQGGTLAALYGALTGDDPSNAWGMFTAAVTALPAISSDDPFGEAQPQPVPPPGPAPAPGPAPTPSPSVVIVLSDDLPAGSYTVTPMDPVTSLQGRKTEPRPR